MRKLKTFFKLIFQGKLFDHLADANWYYNRFFFARKYRFNIEQYKESFLSNSFDIETISADHQIPKKVYCYWTGNNEMSANRKNCLEILKRNIGCEVLLVTPENLSDFILKKHPLHPAYPYLSLVHKSDYLRCYFMHFYGGGYTDIKKHQNLWGSMFAEVQNNSNKWLLGYKEVGVYGISEEIDDADLLKDLKKNWSVLVGNGSYIFRPQTAFTYEWYDELNKRLDVYSDCLKKYPGNIMGDNKGYPIGWSEILGQIFHPLCLKYHEKIVYNNNIKPNLSDYR